MGELVSLEEIQKRCKLKYGLTKGPYTLKQDRHPLLIIFKEMRNLEFHLSTNTVSKISKDLVWGNKKEPEKATPICMSFSYIDNLSMDTFIKLDGFLKKYEFVSFEKALEWFDASQKEWGIQEMIFRGLNLYVEKLILHHGLHYRDEKWLFENS